MNGLAQMYCPRCERVTWFKLFDTLIKKTYDGRANVTVQTVRCESFVEGYISCGHIVTSPLQIALAEARATLRLQQMAGKGSAGLE